MIQGCIAYGAKDVNLAMRSMPERSSPWMDLINGPEAGEVNPPRKGGTNVPKIVNFWIFQM